MLLLKLMTTRNGAEPKALSNCSVAFGAAIAIVTKQATSDMVPPELPQSVLTRGVFSVAEER